MRIYKQKRMSFFSLAIFMAVFILVIAMFSYGINNATLSSEKQSVLQLQEAIKRAAIGCYATEGFYPADVAYLKSHYGIKIDSNKYAVVYETLGSNIMPYIKVVLRGTGGETNGN